MFTSTGILHYSNNPIKLMAEVDPGLFDFYRNLIPQYLRVNRPMFDGHISIVRKVEPPNMQYWNKHQGKNVEFSYEPYVYNDELYYWLNVYSKELEEVRSELGLLPYGDVTESPDGRHRFHLTLGNLKK